ncbi:MAG: extracellular solute-binding protein [Clostridia bacterium]|nr:extracellular solute-binding protein [Clostridia bacterium]
MMKTVYKVFFFTLLLLISLCLLTACGDDQPSTDYPRPDLAGTTLYVYNWGEYISDGTDDSLDVIKVFEETYGITVKYDYFDTNENLYSQIDSDAAYDVIFPSDYMIERMIQNNLLQPIDKSKLSNYELIMQQYRNMSYDMGAEEDQYSIPYSVGMIGIVYNTQKISEEDAARESWDLLWDTDYGTGELINFNNPRDAFGVAMLHLGLNINSTNPEDWEKAYRHLREQNCIYLMDEVFDKMERGTASAAAYYAGDCITMMEANEDLDFYYPKEGTNKFVDAMCIPKNAKNVEAAHLFIDFMLSPDIATANANYIGYASPNSAVLTHEEYYYSKEADPDAYDILYGTSEDYFSEYYVNLDEETLALMTDYWTKLGLAEEEEGLAYGTVIFLGLIGIGLVMFFVHYGKKIYVIIKNKKMRKA